MCMTRMLHSPFYGGFSKRRTVCLRVLVTFQILSIYRQVKMDYALVHAVQHGMDPQQHVITFYDINCQYKKNLACQLKGNNFVSLPDGLQIQPGISLWHVHGHKAECFSRYAPMHPFHPRTLPSTQPLRFRLITCHHCVCQLSLHPLEAVYGTPT